MATTAETLQIDGMTCAHCVRAVQTALERLPGVTVDDVQIGRADVRYDDAQASRQALVAAIEQEGYGILH